MWNTVQGQSTDSLVWFDLNSLRNFNFNLTLSYHRLYLYLYYFYIILIFVFIFSKLQITS